MNKLSLSILILSGLFSCSNAVENNQKVTKIEVIELVDENGKVSKHKSWSGEGEMPKEIEESFLQDAQTISTIATIGIEGMSCAKMCAGAIQKTLSETKGVISCEVKFEEKIAVVNYDETQINEKRIIKSIEFLNEGQYKVTSVEVKKKVQKQDTESKG